MIFSEGSTTFAAPHGSLALHVWPATEDSAGPPVVAVHGVDGNHESWAPVVEGLDGRRTVIGVDLRGRGASAQSGPFGVAAHAEDVAAVVAALGVEVVLVGHSFGGHVAARVGADATEGIVELVLVDGGPPRLVPDGMAPEALVAGALSNIVPNLGSKPFPISQEAVETDFASMVVDPVGARPLFDVDLPVRLLRAELGVAPTLPPVVPDAVVQELRDAGVDLRDEVVADVTHFSILASRAVVDALG